MSIKNFQSGCLDVIVIQQPNGTLRSTPFQIVFSYFATKGIKNNHVDIEINGTKTNIKMKLNQYGRALFEKKFIKNNKNIFDSSDYSSEDDLPERESSKERSTSPKRSFLQNSSKLNAQIAKLSAKNQPVPFWQFFWQTKKPESETSSSIIKKQQQQTILQKIQEQDYQGQETSNDPDFLISLCGDQLQKNQNLSPKEILKLFYAHQVKQKDFMKDPSGIISNQNLVVKIRQSIYTWEIGLTLLVSKYAFGTQLSNNQINQIIQRKKNQGWLRFLSNQKRKFVIQTDKTDKDTISSVQTKAPIIQNQQVITRLVKVPSSDILKQLNLRKGVNFAKFSIEGSNTPLECRIYLWDYKTKIVISDIDGTITTSDVFGQLMHVFNQKYIHQNIVKLYQKFKQQGYEIVYLTARAISQYKDTQQFLFQFLKEDDIYMPLGPVFTSPDGLFSSFKRQLIDKQPDFLKTQILTVIRQCFPITINPYFCGFGNKSTDATAYNKLIKPERIYIISENSQIYIPSQKEFQTNYTELLQKFDQFFVGTLVDECSQKSFTDAAMSPIFTYKQVSVPDQMIEEIPRLQTQQKKCKSAGEESNLDYSEVEI